MVLPVMENSIVPLLSILHFVVPSPSRTWVGDEVAGCMEVNRSMLLHICWVAPLSTTKVSGDLIGGDGETTGLLGDFG